MSPEQKQTALETETKRSLKQIMDRNPGKLVGVWILEVTGELSSTSNASATIQVGAVSVIKDLLMEGLKGKA